MNFSNIAIIGPGLLGGSIALGLRSRGFDGRIGIWARRAEAVDELRGKKLADPISTDLETVVRDAGLVVLCVPIGSMTDLAAKMAPALSRGTIVTDVGSVKASLCEQLEQVLASRARFVGSHPMAGSEQAGFAAARADLFQNAVCIVTPDKRTDCEAVAAVEDFWRFLGSTVSRLDPRQHDEAVALVSHLPHLVAAALIQTACSENIGALAFCGNGFRDTTRVASGPPAMWSEILEQNRLALKKSTHAMIEKLNAVIKLLDSGDRRALQDFLETARRERDRLKHKQ